MGKYLIIRGLEDKSLNTATKGQGKWIVACVAECILVGVAECILVGVGHNLARGIATGGQWPPWRGNVNMFSAILRTSPSAFSSMFSC